MSAKDQHQAFALPPFFQKWVDANRSLERMVLRMARQGSSPQSCATYVFEVVQFANSLIGREGAKEYLTGPDDVLKMQFDWPAVINENLDRMIIKEGLSKSSGLKRLSAVKRWLRVNDVRVNWDDVEAPPKEPVESERTPTRENLKALCGVADLVDRVIIEVAVSSGLRVGSIVSLQLKHIELEREVPCIRVPREIAKGRKSFVTFLTPEAKAAVQSYIRQREMRGEKISPESYLIVSEKPRGRKVGVHAIHWRWVNLLRRAELAERGRRWHFLRFHTLRKYFKTWCSLSGVNSEVVEYMMGHRSGVKNVYFVPDDAAQVQADVVSKLEAEYRKALPALEIMSEGEKVKELETRLKETTREYERKLEELRSNQDVIAELLRNERAREQFMLRQNEKIKEMARELAELKAQLQRKRAKER